MRKGKIMISKKRDNYICGLLLLITVILLVVISYYSEARYVGDTALYAQITKNISETGKAEGNIFANTQDFIDRSIAAIPIDERLASEEAFEPPIEQSRNILRFHSCFILYLIAPLCYFMTAYSAVTLAQAVALAFSLFFCVQILREKKVPPIIIFTVTILLVSHPGWSLPAVYGAFYPERLFMGTGMYLVWACEKEKFSKGHFVIATILCMLVGERGALYAGMFILAHTIFYWKDKVDYRKLRLYVGIVAVAYCVVMMKFVLDNLYYSNLGADLNFIAYLSMPQNREKVVLFLTINIFLFLLVAIFDWRAFIIGAASMIPNLLYDNGGAEKIGWTLHYHVFYFVFLMWAVTQGVIKLYHLIERKNKNKYMHIGIPVGISFLFAFLGSIINPMDTAISINISNVQNNVICNAPKEIQRMYFSGGRENREMFNELVKASIPEGATVSTIEGGMCALESQNVHLFPMGIKNADMALVSYYKSEEGYLFGGSVVYFGPEEQQEFDKAVMDKMQQYGYDFEKAILFPSYGVAIIPRT